MWNLLLTSKKRFLSNLGKGGSKGGWSGGGGGGGGGCKLLTLLTNRECNSFTNPAKGGWSSGGAGGGSKGGWTQGGGTSEYIFLLATFFISFHLMM